MSDERLERAERARDRLAAELEASTSALATAVVEAVRAKDERDAIRREASVLSSALDAAVALVERLRGMLTDDVPEDDPVVSLSFVVANLRVLVDDAEERGAAWAVLALEHAGCTDTTHNCERVAEAQGRRVCERMRAKELS